MLFWHFRGSALRALPALRASVRPSAVGVTVRKTKAPYKCAGAEVAAAQRQDQLRARRSATVARQPNGTRAVAINKG